MAEITFTALLPCFFFSFYLVVARLLRTFLAIWDSCQMVFLPEENHPVGNFLGTYVCGHTYFMIMFTLCSVILKFGANTTRTVWGLFWHLPDLRDFGATTARHLTTFSKASNFVNFGPNMSQAGLNCYYYVGS